MIRFLMFVFAMMCPVLVFSNDTVAASKVSAQTSNGALGAGAMISQVVVALAAVTAIILVLAWCVKRLGGGAMLQQRGMKLTSVLPVGAREKVVLLEVENKKLLLGVASGHVSFLYAFDDANAVNPAATRDRAATDSERTVSDGSSAVTNSNAEKSSTNSPSTNRSTTDSGDSASDSSTKPVISTSRSTQAFIFGDGNEKWDFSSTLKKLLKDGERR